jgi:hypothetical protein
LGVTWQDVIKVDDVININLTPKLSVICASQVLKNHIGAYKTEHIKNQIS